MDQTPLSRIPFDVRLRTDDDSMRELARRYWAARFGAGQSLEYPDTVKSLAESFGITTPRGVVRRVNEVAVAEFGKCSGCNEPLVLRSRMDLAERLSRRHTHAHICEACWERQRAAEREAGEAAHKRKWAEHARRQESQLRQFNEHMRKHLGLGDGSESQDRKVFPAAFVTCEFKALDGRRRIEGQFLRGDGSSKGEELQVWAECLAFCIERVNSILTSIPSPPGADAFPRLNTELQTALFPISIENREGETIIVASPRTS